MKRSLPLICAISLIGNVLIAQDDIMSVEAQYTFGSSQNDMAKVIDYDSDGNIYILGEFRDDMDCDPTSSEYLMENQGQPDVFLGKYNDQGETIWAFGLGRIALDGGMSAGGLQVASDGSLYISGSFSSFVDFDPSEESTTLTSTGGRDAFLAKYDTDGALVWVNQYGTSSTELSTTCALDADENITFALRFSEAIDVDLGDGEAILSPMGGADVAAIRVDSDGEHLWSYQISSAEADEISAMTYTSDGRLAIGANIDGVSTPFPESNMYLAVIGADGNLSWDIDFQNLEQNNEISCFAFDEDNSHMYIGGRIRGSTDFDPDGDGIVIDPLFADPFFAKYDLTTGDIVYAKHIESSGTEDYTSGITVAGSALFITGSFDVSAVFNPGDFLTQIPSAGGMDIYMAAYDRLTGDYITAEATGGEGDERAVHAIFTPTGTVYSTGVFSTSLKLLPDEAAIDAVGFTDMFFTTFTYETAMSDGLDQYENSFKMYPVPVSNTLNVRWLESFGKNEIYVTVSNVVGQVVRETKWPATQNQLNLDVSEFNPGIYIMTFKSEGVILSKRFVKQ